MGTNTRATEKSREKGIKISSWLGKNNTYLVFAGMITVCCILSANFYTIQNITNLLKQNTIIGVITMGMLLVILMGDIDLSVGAICGAANVIVSVIATRQKMPIEFAVLMAIALGMAMGAANGFFIVYKKLPAFIVTLAMMTIGRGFAYIWSKGAPISVTSGGIKAIGTNYFLGLPILVWFLILVFGGIFFLLRYTSYGRIVKAIGSNAEAVRLAGLRVNTYRFSVYLIDGFLCALAGVLGCARTGVGSPLFGEGFELDAIAMVVIGGANLNGGKGDAVKTLVGIFIIGMISNIMNLINVSAYLQQVIKGFIILAAIYLQGNTDKKTA